MTEERRYNCADWHEAIQVVTSKVLDGQGSSALSQKAQSVADHTKRIVFYAASAHQSAHHGDYHMLKNELTWLQQQLDEAFKKLNQKEAIRPNEEV